VRKEDSIYAYESGDGVNCVLITSILLALNAPFETGLASQSGLTTSAAQFTFANLAGSEGNQTTKVPFTIDQDEVVGASTIWADLFGNDTALQGNVIGEYLLPEPLSAEHPIDFVSISKSSGGMIGRDVVIWQEKESLNFSAENTAIAVALTGLIEFGVSEHQIVQAYPLVRNHPKIPELRRLILAEQGYPDEESLLDQIADIRVTIALDVIESVRSELSPQRVITQFPLLPFPNRYATILREANWFPRP
jgi:hypothetical protein